MVFYKVSFMCQEILCLIFVSDNKETTNIGNFSAQFFTLTNEEFILNSKWNIPCWEIVWVLLSV
jgi:hypothetical protein